MWSQFISRNQRNRMKSTSQMRSRQDLSQQWKGLHTCCHSDTWLRNSFTPPPPPPMAKRIRGFICILLIIHCLVSRLHLFMWACMSPLSSLPFFYFPSSPFPLPPLLLFLSFPSPLPTSPLPLIFSPPPTLYLPPVLSLPVVWCPFQLSENQHTYTCIL